MEEDILLPRHRVSYGVSILLSTDIRTLAYRAASAAIRVAWFSVLIYRNEGRPFTILDADFPANAGWPFPACRYSVSLGVLAAREFRAKSQVPWCYQCAVLQAQIRRECARYRWLLAGSLCFTGLHSASGVGLHWLSGSGSGYGCACFR